MKDGMELFKSTIWEKIFIHFNYFSHDEYMEAAIHEAAHCLVGELLYPTIVKQVGISVVPTLEYLIKGKCTEIARNTNCILKGDKKRVRFRAGVYGGTLVDDFMMQKDYFNMSMIAAAGGIAVCNILNQESAIGCDNDMDCIETYIKGMIEQEGIQTEDAKDTRYKEIMADMESKTNIMIAQNKDKLIALAEELAKKKRLTGREVRKILKEV